jgi:hypothetical protein
MIVVITRNVAGPDGTFSIGQIYDLPVDLANRLIAGYAAEPLTDAQREAKTLRAPHMARVETRG